MTIDPNKFAPTSPSRVALRDRFKAVRPPASERVTVDLGDGEPVAVEVRALTAGERWQLVDGASDEASEGGKVRLRIAEYTPRLLALSVVDPESGQRLWNPQDPADLDTIGQLPHAVVERLSEAAAKLSGLNKEAADHARNGSSPAATVASSTT